MHYFNGPLCTFIIDKQINDDDYVDKKKIDVGKRCKQRLKIVMMHRKVRYLKKVKIKNL